MSTIERPIKAQIVESSVDYLKEFTIKVRMRYPLFLKQLPKKLTLKFNKSAYDFTQDIKEDGAESKVEGGLHSIRLQSTVKADHYVESSSLRVVSAELNVEVSPLVFKLVYQPDYHLSNTISLVPEEHKCECKLIYDKEGFLGEFSPIDLHIDSSENVIVDDITLNYSIVKSTKEIFQHVFFEREEEDIIPIQSGKDYQFKDAHFKDNKFSLCSQVSSNKELDIEIQFKLAYTIEFSETGFQMRKTKLLRVKMSLFYPFDHIDSYQVVNPGDQNTKSSNLSKLSEYPVGK